jgi:hypothetical protein
VLRSPALLDPANWMGDDPHLQARAEAGLVSFSAVHAWACRQAGIELRDHPEIRSEERQPPADPWRWAFTHPHKWLEVEEVLAIGAGRVHPAPTANYASAATGS